MIENTAVYRILDANLNRLREGLRVIEEFFRFVKNDAEMSIQLKGLRHALQEIESLIGRDNLIANRDTVTDCFSVENRPEELTRECIEDIVIAGFKRSQEASRVLEEYTKIGRYFEASETAKKMRFALYEIENRIHNSEYENSRRKRIAYRKEKPEI